MNTLLKYLLFILFLGVHSIDSLAQCTPNVNADAFRWISKVQLNTIDNSSGSNGYIYYSDPKFITDLEKGKSYPVSVTLNTNNSNGFDSDIAIWVDLNNDASFSSSERIFTGVCGTANCTVTGNLDIPETAATGIVRMRISFAFNSGGPETDPCSSFPTEVEDYPVSLCSGKMMFKEVVPEQLNLTNIVPGTNNNEMMRIKLRNEGCSDPFRASKFVFKITGTTDTADIAAAKLFYGYKSDKFATGTQIDTTLINPGNTLMFTDYNTNRYLLSDSTYFWLAYDLSPQAKSGNYVDAELVSVMVNDTIRVPVISAPAGKRLIDEKIYYYSKKSGNANQLSTWGSNIDGTGNQPPNFTNEDTHYIITDSSTLTSNGNWTVNSSGSAVVIQNGGTLKKAAANTFTFPLRLHANSVLELSGNSGSNAIAPQSFDSLSTVIYKEPGAFKPLWPYGNLVIDGASATTAFSTGTSNSMTVKNNLTVERGVLTLHSTGTPPTANTVTHRIKNNLVINNNGTVQASNINGDQGTCNLIVSKNIIMSGNAKLYGSTGNSLTAAVYSAKNLIMNTGSTFKGTNTNGNFTLNVTDTLLIQSGTFILADSLSTASAPTLNVGTMQVKGGSAIISKVGGNTGNANLNVSGSLETISPGKFTMYSATAPRTNYTGRITFVNPSSGSSVIPGNFSITPSTDDVRGAQLNVVIQDKRAVTLKSDVNLGIDKTFTVNGTLVTGTYKVKNASANTTGTVFTLADNATLDIGSVEGITTTGATGSIQTVTRTFSTNASYKYSGTAAQVTGNGIPATVKGLIANNTKHVQTSKNITVNTLLEFASTPAFLLTDTLKLGTAASVSGNGPKQFVKGNILKKFTAATPFLFPTGDTLQGGFYAPVEVIPLSAGTDYLARFIYKDPTTDSYNTSQKESGIGNVSSTYYYRIERRAGTGDATVNLFYNLSDPAIVNQNGLTISRWNVPTASKWNLLSTTVNKASLTLLGVAQTLSPAGIFTIAGKSGSGNFGEQVPPLAGFTADKLSGCSGVSIQFSDTSANATEWNWSFPGGTPSVSTLQSPVVTYSTAGTYNVTLLAKNPYGEDTEAKNSYITVTNCSKPDASFTTASPSTGCAPLTVQFTDQSSNAVSWNWTFTGGNPSSSTSQMPQVTYQTPGSYSVRLIATNQAGSDTLIQANYVTVQDCSAPAAAFTSDTTQGCEGKTIKFFDQSTNATSWNWTFIGGTPSASSDQNPVVTYNAAGNYKVTLVANNDYGSATEAKNDYISIKLCAAPAAGFTANQTTICKDGQVSFTDQSSNAVSWEWTFEGGTPSSSADQNPVVTYSTPGTYDVTLKAINNNGNDTKVMDNYITVNNCTGSMPSAAFTYTVNTDNVQFTNQSLNADSYKWEFGDGNTSLQANPVYSYATSGTYTVCLNAINVNGSDTTCKDIVVTTIGVQEMLSSTEVRIYPNPATDQISILLTDNLARLENVELIDTRGRIILRSKDNKIAISDLNNGLYLIRIQTDKGTALQKVQIMR